MGEKMADCELLFDKNGHEMQKSTSENCNIVLPDR